MKQSAFNRQLAGILIFLLCSVSVFAAQYDLDSNFGTGGTVTANINGGEDGISTISILPDGSILAVGYGFTQDYDVLLLKYDSSGNPDSNFGTGGKRVYDYGKSEFPADLKVLPSGYFLVLTRQDGLTKDYLLTRYTTTGTTDIFFGTQGKELLDFAGTDDAPSALGVQSTGKIVVAGTVTFGVGPRIGLARYNQNGGLDTNFGISGKMTNSLSGLAERGYAMLILNDDSILVAGQIDSGANNADFFLAKYTPEGQPDTTFGQNGWTKLDLTGKDDYVRAIALQGNKIILAGQVKGTDGTKDLGVARFHDNGDLDTDFGTGGKTITNFSGQFLSSDEEIKDIAIGSDGKIVITGNSKTFITSTNLLVGRYTQNGLPDTTFSPSGFSTLDINGNYDYGNSVAIQTDGKIVIGGSTSPGADRDTLLARFLGTGSPGGGNPGNCSGALFCDLFDSNILDPDWNYMKPTWNEANGKLNGTPSGKKAVAIAESGWVSGTQYTIQTTMRNAGGTSNTVWLLGWYADNKNYIELLMKEETDKWILKHHSNGVVVSKGKGAKTIVPNQAYSVKVQFDGSKVQVFVDDFGTPLITMQVSASVAPGTVGYQVKNTTGSFDFIRVD